MPFDSTRETEAIGDLIGMYAEYHGIERSEVDVSYTYDGNGTRISVRLSLDIDGRQRGADEVYPLNTGE